MSKVVDRYCLVMPAAGGGQRFGGDRPKQYQTLAGQTVMEWSLAVFASDARCEQIIVALAADDQLFRTLPVGLRSRIETVTGGATRSASVQAGLAALGDPVNRWVMVHDAARPCLEQEDRDALLAAVNPSSAGGAVLAARLADTLKREVIAKREVMAKHETADSNASRAAPSVSETVNRDGLWRALTPQLFRADRLQQALQAAHAQGREPTDEAQAMEWQNEPVRLIEARHDNPKITRPADLLLAQALLAQRGTERTSNREHSMTSLHDHFA